MTTNDEDRIMTPAETAEYMQMAEGTLETWRKRRTGPDYMRIGKHVRYRRSAVDAWLESRTRKAV